MEEPKTFDSGRQDLMPYGLTCEKWSPQVAPRIDRHNEIEINLFPQGGATYFFNNKAIEIPSGRIAIFWALIPHQTLAFQDNSSYYVCTIPLVTFLSWNIDKKMVNDLFAGKMLVSPELASKSFDIQLMDTWISDLQQIDQPNLQEVVLTEMMAKVKRLSLDYSILNTVGDNYPIYTGTIFSEDGDKITKIADYVARNFKRALKASEIGKAIGLHPDYMNRLCIKAFGCTLHQYVLQARVNYAERILITTDTPVTDIALESGFSTVARFNATFLKQKQMTPSEYRKFFQNNK